MIVQLRVNWAFEDCVYALRDGTRRLFDPAVRDVSRLHAQDIALIRKAKDTP